MGEADCAWTASLLSGSRTARRLALIVTAALLTMVAVLGCPAASTITDLGALNTSAFPYNQPVAVNALQDVVLAKGSLWVNGTVSTAQAPASGPDPTATFGVDSEYDGPLGLGPGSPIINDVGVVVGGA
jgi:hypothetical protein